MKLKLGQNIYIDNQKFKAISMIECKKDDDTTEKLTIERYELLSEDNNTILWLIIENADLENDRYYIFEECEINPTKYYLARKQEQYQEYSDVFVKITKTYGDTSAYAGDFYSLKQCKLGAERIFIESISYTYVYYGSVLEKDRIYITNEIDKETVINCNDTKNAILEFLKRFVYMILGIGAIALALLIMTDII